MTLIMELLNKSNYSNYNLNYNTIVNLVFTFILILISFSYLSLHYVKETKKLAWMISVLNSFIMSIIGIFYIYYKIGDVVSIIMSGTGGRNIFHGLDNVSAIACLWFGLANVADLIFGFMYYHKEQGLLTAYFHHSVFIWIMVICTTGKGLIVNCVPFAPTFLFMCIEEIPTFLLALGTVNKTFRTDIGFGITFFSLRIVYHSLFLLSSVFYGADTVVTFLYALTFTMHLYWFYGWYTKYGKKLTTTKDKM